MQLGTVNMDWHDSLFISNRHQAILAHICHTAEPDEWDGSSHCHMGRPKIISFIFYLFSYLIWRMWDTAQKKNSMNLPSASSNTLPWVKKTISTLMGHSAKF